MFLALFGLEIMIFLNHAYLTFECSTLLLEEDRFTVISMWSGKECGWSEIKVNASPKDQHWHCSAQRLQLSTEGLISAFVVVQCLSGMMMKASIFVWQWHWWRECVSDLRLGEAYPERGEREPKQLLVQPGCTPSIPSPLLHWTPPLYRLLPKCFRIHFNTHLYYSIWHTSHLLL